MHQLAKVNVNTMGSHQVLATHSTTAEHGLSMTSHLVKPMTISVKHKNPGCLIDARWVVWRRKELLYKRIVWSNWFKYTDRCGYTCTRNHSNKLCSHSLQKTKQKHFCGSPGTQHYKESFHCWAMTHTHTNKTIKINRHCYNLCEVIK